jgi:hypothetical protein
LFSPDLQTESILRRNREYALPLKSLAKSELWLLDAVRERFGVMDPDKNAIQHGISVITFSTIRPIPPFGTIQL